MRREEEDEKGGMMLEMRGRGWDDGDEWEERRRREVRMMEMSGRRREGRMMEMSGRRGGE